MAIEIVQTILPTFLWEDCPDSESNTTVVTVQSDAILKPRIIQMDGYASKYQFSGNVDLGSPANLSYAEGRYHFLYSNQQDLVNLVPALGGNNPFEYSNLSKSFTQSDIGGRGGGCIVSNNLATYPNGNWLLVPFKSDSTVRGGGICLGMDLQGVALLEDLNIINFVSSYGPDNANRSIIIGSHLVIAIKSDLTITAKRFTGSDWTDIIDTSNITVPSVGPFTIEAGSFASTSASGISSPTGFVYVRLHLPGDPVGQTAIRKLNVVTASGTNGIVGIAYGTDARGKIGTGIGVPGIKIDADVIYDAQGSVKKYLRDTRVSRSNVIKAGDSAASDISFGGYIHGVADRWVNVSIPDQPNLYTNPQYNTFLSGKIDTYGIEQARPDALEILAVSPCCTKVHWQFAQFAPNGNAISEASQLGGATFQSRMLIKIGGTTLLGDDAVGDFSWISDACVNVYETNPNTPGIEFQPSDIGNILIGHTSSVAATSVAMLLYTGLDYVWHETKVIETEHAPFPPVAAFVTVINDGPLNTDYGFASTSVDWDGTIVSYRWDLGDGTIVTTPSVTHKYIHDGTYTVTLLVTDNDGLTSSAATTIVVPNQAPTADFSFAADPADLTGLTVKFTDLSVDPDGSVASWNWDFGDGSPHSTLQNPTHIYAGAGTPLVTLIVTDNHGAVSAPFTVEVDVPIIAGGGDCTLSSDALANVAWLQGDDWHGGNPPLPNYANTASLDNYLRALLVFREAYDFCHDVVNDGTSHFLDTVKTFNGHNTYGMNFGQPAATTYRGGGWTTIPTDDGDPVETYYTVNPFGPTKYWLRRIWNADAGVMSQAGVGAGPNQVGLLILQITGAFNLITLRFFNRNGRIYLEYTNKSVQDGVNNTAQFDVCNENIFVGRGDTKFGELGVRLALDNIAHNCNIKVWAGDACTLTGVSPILNQTIDAFGTTAHPTLSFGNGTDSFNGQLFTPTGALKQLNVALWEQEDEDKTGTLNPYGYSLV